MLYPFLAMSWKEMLMTDYETKSNSTKRVIEFVDGLGPADELFGGQETAALVFYNMYTNMPMVFVEKFKPVDYSIPSIDKIRGMIDENVRPLFNISVNFDSEDGVCEIVLTRKDLYEALLDDGVD